MMLSMLVGKVIMKLTKSKESVNEDCGLDHSTMTGKCPECGKTTEVEEAVSVDMRTIGFKSALARNLLRREKAAANLKKSEIDEIIDATNKKLRGESMVASGSAETGAIAGKDMPLSKKKKVLKKFKDIIEASDETKARMKRELDKGYAAQLKLKLKNATDSLKELAFDLDNKVQTVDPKISKELIAKHKELKKFIKTFNDAIKAQTT